MAGEHSADRSARALDIAGGIVGILVFIAGIAMIIMVFTWVRGVFDDVDEQVQQVRIAREAHARAQTRAETAATATDPVDAAAPADGSVVARPYEGPTIAYVGVTIALKMLGLLVLGWLGALVASRGAQLAGAHRGKRE